MSSIRWEAALLTKVIETADAKSALKAGVNAKGFADDVCRQVWTYIVAQYQNPKFRGVPSMPTIEARFPLFQPIKTRESLSACIELFKEGVCHRDISKMIEKAKEKAAETDSIEALGYMRSQILNISAKIHHSDVVDLSDPDQADELRDEYLKAKESGGVIGLPFPWQALTQAGGGAEPGDLIAFAGRPGSMKSWVMQCIMHYWQEEHELSVLMCSKEMNEKRLRRRAAALKAKVDYNKIRTGTASPEEEARYFAALKAMKDMPNYRIKRLRSYGMDALAEIQALCDDFEPDVVGVDGWYFLSDRDPALTGKLTTHFKQYLDDTGLVGLINTQLNQESEKDKGSYDRTTGGAYGDSYSQDGDYFLKLRFTKEDRRFNELVIFAPKIREGQGQTFAINARPGVDMTQKRLIDDDLSDIGGRLLGGDDDSSFAG